MRRRYASADGRGLQPLDDGAEAALAARVAARLRHRPQPARAQPRVLVERLLQERDERVDEPRPRRDLLHAEARVGEHALDGVMMAAELRADRADRPALDVVQAEDRGALLRGHRTVASSSRAPPFAGGSAHGRRARVGRAARRRRSCRGGIHSLGRTCPESTRPQRAQRTASPAAGRRSSARFDASCVDTSVSRVGSTSELDGEGGVGAARSSVEFVSVTCRLVQCPPLPPRACRARFEAIPFGVLAYTGWPADGPRCRRSAAHPAQQAPDRRARPAEDEHPPASTTSPNPTVHAPLLLGAAGRAPPPPHASTRRRASTRPPRRPGWSDPGLHLLHVE